MGSTRIINNYYFSTTNPYLVQAETHRDHLDDKLDGEHDVERHVHVRQPDSDVRPGLDAGGVNGQGDGREEDEEQDEPLEALVERHHDVGVQVDI